MPRPPWGSLVAAALRPALVPALGTALAAALAPACAARPQPQPAPPQPVAPEPTPEPTPAMFAPRLSPASPALPLDQFTVAGALTARGGAFDVAYLDAEKARCAALLGPEAPCRFIRVRRGDGPWGAPVPVAQAWASLSDGQGVVYASRADRPLAIDAIDADGKITALYDTPDDSEKQEKGKKKKTQMREVKVAAVSSGLFVIGQEIASDYDGYFVSDPLSLIFLEHKGGRLVEARRVKLPITITGQTARDARRIGAGRVGYGQWDLAPSLDASGAPGPLAAMAWTEVKAPPKAPSPWQLQIEAQKKQERLERLERLKQGKKNGKHACRAVGRSIPMGCASSRSLDEEGITRRRRLTMLTERGKIAKDIVIEEKAGPDGAAGRGLRALPGGWIVDAVRVGSDLKSKKPASDEAPSALPPLTMRAPERLLQAAWDALAGEGIAELDRIVGLVGQGETRRAWRRFSAEGAWLGDPAPLPRVGRAAPHNLLRAQGEWYGAEHGAYCQLRESSACWRLVAGPAAVGKCTPNADTMVFPSPGDTRTTFFTLACDRELTVASLAAGDDGRPRITAARKLGGEGQAVAAARAADGHAWALVEHVGEPARLVPEDNTLESITLRSPTATLHRVGRSVVVREHGPGARLIWLGTGVSVAAQGFDEAGDEGGAEPPAARKPAPAGVGAGVIGAGALLPGGRLMLGERPGEVRELPEEIARVARRCGGAFLAAPGRLLLVCTEPIEGSPPAAVTLRRVDF
jgi:hypothetical protein